MDLASTLNPREVLSYLNELGIRNVSSEMLKEFIRDLKKLIRLDQQRKIYTANVENQEYGDKTGPERLHSCSTFSSRLKSVNSSERRKPLSCTNSQRDVKQNVSKTNVIDCKRASSAKICERQNKHRQTSLPSCSSKATVRNVSSGGKTSSNLIKVPIPEKPKKSDPVSLYHHYNALWEKYKSNLPGENSWADLRWSVREKLAGAIQEKPKPVMTVQSKEMLAKRREGWVE